MLYLLSGSIGVNPPMLAIELAIVLVGTTAGLIGLDRFLVPSLRQHHARTGDQPRSTAAAAPAQPLRRAG